MNQDIFIEQMRQEVRTLGVTETKTPEAVDAALKNSQGTLLVFMNSVCGCSAGSARPALRLALQTSDILPKKMITVFAGQDKDATAQVRAYIQGYAPSSPSIWLFRDGKVVHAIERYQIEGRSPEMIAENLVDAFHAFCGESQMAE